MNAKRFSLKSIRVTVFLLYALILLVTFSIFSSFVYSYFHHEIYRKVDTILNLKAQGLDSAIRTYLKTRKIDASSGWAAFFAGFQQREDHFSTIADFLTQSELYFTQDQPKMVVNIFNEKGLLLASTNKKPAISSLDREILKDVLQGHKRIHTFRLISEKKKSLWMRAITQPIMENKQLLYIVQVRVLLGSVEGELAGIARMLIVLVILTLLVTSWAGFLLVRITLRPVDQIVRRIRNIRSDSLDLHLNLPHANDEIRRLTFTFNEMLERLRHSFDTQKKMVQDLSHELKTPLTILRGQLEVALKRPRSLEEYQSLLSSSLDEIEGIRKIIDDLLMLARLQSPAPTLEMKNVDLNALIQSVVEDTKVLARSKNMEWVFQAEGPCFIQANQIHLRRLFMNLLDNAVKYTPVGGRIGVELRMLGSNARVLIKDNGNGIDPVHLPYIFDRFYRAEKDSRKDGFGLGLSIVKSIVDAHKGRIEVQSALGQGTTFLIFFSMKSQMNFFNSLP